MKHSIGHMSRVMIVAVALAALPATSGCSGYSAAEHRVEASQARNTLNDVLTSWQQGATPDSWQQKSPQVVVQDMDWKAGIKLRSFEIKGEGEAVDANLYCPVMLTLEDPKKGKVVRTVTYIVGTSPVLTVFRSPGP